MAFDTNAALRTLLGLEPDATEADIQAAMEAQQDDEPDEQVTTTGDSGEDEADDATGSPGDSGSTTGEPSATVVPEGAVLVDASAWARVQQDATRGAAARAAQISAERTAFLDAAQREGRITRTSRLKHWEPMLRLGGDPERLARETIGSFPKNHAVPVDEVGYGDDTANIDAASSYDMSWLTPNERTRVNAARGTER